MHNNVLWIRSQHFSRKGHYRRHRFTKQICLVHRCLAIYEPLRQAINNYIWAKVKTYQKIDNLIVYTKITLAIVILYYMYKIEFAGQSAIVIGHCIPYLVTMSMLDSSLLRFVSVIRRGAQTKTISLFASHTVWRITICHHYSGF